MNNNVEGATIFFVRGGGQNILGFINFLKELGGGHKIFDDHNVRSHIMTTDNVFILFKKTDFNTILSCLGVRCIDGGEVTIFFGGGEGEEGCNFIDAELFVNLGPFSKGKDSSLRDKI